MANGLEQTMRSAAKKIAQYVEDVTTMTVQTSCVQVGVGSEVDFEPPKLVARTIIKLDGDCEAILPMRQTQNGGFEVDTALLDLHQRTGTAAMEYWERILHALLGALPSLGR